MTLDDQAPRTTPWADLERPSAARVYDWYLGGEANYAIDREFGKKAVQTFPLIRPMARSNRNWLGRVVRAALDEGITQFLDLGTGIPTVGNIHDIIRPHPGARVVYVDNEAVATAHTRYILERESADSWVGIVEEHLRNAQAIFDDPTTQRLLDLSQPVCVLLASVLHFLGGGDRPEALVADYRRGIAPGSWLALSHATNEDTDPEQAAQVETLRDAYKNTQNPGWLRGREEIRTWFAGFDLVEPGLVHLPDWRPHQAADELEVEQDVRAFYWGGAGRVR